jgi:hypothetical protein
VKSVIRAFSHEKERTGPSTFLPSLLRLKLLLLQKTVTFPRKNLVQRLTDNESRARESASHQRSTSSIHPLKKQYCTLVPNKDIIGDPARKILTVTTYRVTECIVLA